jgi:Leucine-rich repeat (LRR) protein
MRRRQNHRNVCFTHSLTLSDFKSRGLSGSITDSIGIYLDALTSINLSGNQLSGQIPSNIVNLDNLQSLYLNDNMLSGSIPASISNLISLNYLFLNDNMLSGLIPEFLGKIGGLKYLGLENNQLSGEIPASIAELTQLTYCSILPNGICRDESFTFTKCGTDIPGMILSPFANHYSVSGG